MEVVPDVAGGEDGLVEEGRERLAFLSCLLLDRCDEGVEVAVGVLGVEDRPDEEVLESPFRLAGVEDVAELVETEVV